MRGYPRFTDCKPLKRSNFDALRASLALPLTAILMLVLANIEATRPVAMLLSEQ
jgi:hypothetical protein